MPHDLDWMLGGKVGFGLKTEWMMASWLGRRQRRRKAKGHSTGYTRIMMTFRARFDMIL
jgi:hypothetical protein